MTASGHFRTSARSRPMSAFAATADISGGGRRRTALRNRSSGSFEGREELPGRATAASQVIWSKKIRGCSYRGRGASHSMSATPRWPPDFACRDEQEGDRCCEVIN
jgi:hypothetical protein